MLRRKKVITKRIYFTQNKNHSNNLLGTFVLICMQKINFITQFFLKILQINSKLVILSNLCIPCYTHLKWVSIWRKPLMSICMQKINFILHVFLEILQRYWKLAILGTVGMPGYAHPKLILSTCRKLLC